MNSSQIHSTYEILLQSLISGQLSNTFDKTLVLAEELQNGSYYDRLNDLKQNYSYLLQYYSTDIDDPQRKQVLNKLVAKLFVLISELHEELLIRNSSNFEFTQKRYFPHVKKYKSPSELLISLKYYHSQSILLAKLEDSHQIELNRLRSNFETALSELFNMYWISSFYESDEKNVFEQIIHESYPGEVEKSILISALTLNLWRMFDERKLMLLFDACESENMAVKQRAIVGLCFILAKYSKFMPYFPTVRNRLVFLTDNQQIVQNFQNVLIQIISTAETDKISKRMKEEILPEVMKISPLMKDKIESDSLLNSDEWNEENPEWQDLLEKSGVTDKLKELSELQLEGADVYMSTFSMLKNFGFFSEICNWFMPFDSGNSAIKELFVTDEISLISAFVGNNVMCNSDKYSFCLSILQMPESQRSMMKNSFKNEADQLAEMANDELLLQPLQVAKNISKQYIQDLFRFFKLYPHHNDFSDMFDFSLTMHRLFLFNNLTYNEGFSLNVAEYYFSKGLYTQALELFEIIQLQTTPTAALYQKIGYMYQQTSQFNKALDAYNKADIIQPDDLWTVRKMALCYRLKGNYTKALEFYQHSDFLQPNHFSISMQIGNSLLQLNRFKEALAIYFKLDALEPDNLKVWRAISWCSFLVGNLKQAEYYINKLIDFEPNTHDYLNAGHIAWCNRKISNALNFYFKSIELSQNEMEAFQQMFKTDEPFLLANGIESYEIPLMIDALNIKR